jgi:1-acyl-sn-glycerol-3-phosphate acyltransferase
VTLHLVAGLWTTVVVFPFADPSGRRDRIRSWSAQLLRFLNVEARVTGEFAIGDGNVLIVANHISWLDIFVLNAHQPARFVAKSEIARWPLAGRMIRNAGTIFVVRERRRDARRVNDDASRALAGGDIVAVFPEGTTTDGGTVLRFRTALLQPIVESRGRVQPVAIRYQSAHGVRSTAPAYVGDESFITSFWRVCGERRLVAELIATPLIAAERVHRRELARLSESAIQTALGLTADATEFDTDAGPAGAAR